MCNHLKKVYGSYELPTAIHKLFRLEEALKKVDLSLEIIGFQPIDDLITYSITPPDLIPFAKTGGDGVHFGFLTDFGQVSDLNDAPIICVSPTNDPPIRYMAHNISQFLNLASSVPHIEMLESFWSYNDNTQIQEHIQRFHDDSTFEWTKMRQVVSEHFLDIFAIQPKSPLPYPLKFQEERNKTITIPTLDGLGVVGEKNTKTTTRKYVFDFHNPLNEKALQHMQDFLKQANRLEKLAFIRDANYRYIVAPGYDEAVLHIIIEQLKTLDLHDEIQRMLVRQ